MASKAAGGAAGDAAAIDAPVGSRKERCALCVAFLLSETTQDAFVAASALVAVELFDGWCESLWRAGVDACIDRSRAALASMRSTAHRSLTRRPCGSTTSTAHRSLTRQPCVDVDGTSIDAWTARRSRTRHARRFIVLLAVMLFVGCHLSGVVGRRGWTSVLAAAAVAGAAGMACVALSLSAPRSAAAPLAVGGSMLLGAHRAAHMLYRFCALELGGVACMGEMFAATPRAATARGSPRLGREYSVETSRGEAPAGTWIFHGD